MNYRDFIARKFTNLLPTGLAAAPKLHDKLFDFQKNVVEQALLRGRYAEFMDTGLGKTICQLEWAKHVPGRVLILAPLAVAEQTKREGEKIDLEVHHSRDGKSKGKVTVANYERLHLFDVSEFNAVALDESSILKSFTGATKQQLCESFARTPFRTCYTATPAPNDYTELGNHSEFLGVKSNTEMLATWFVHDSGQTGVWRLKGHAEKQFWHWIGTWAACVEKPSDAGGKDELFELPALDVRIEDVECDYASGAEEGFLFRVPEMSATSMHREKRLSLNKRIERVIHLAAGKDFKLIWCETNEESKEIAAALGDDCVEVCGADSLDEKEEKIVAFSLGQVRCMVTKPTIAGFGLNWQHCNHQIFASISYSYEQFYQAVRRSWRFGQKRPVRIDVVLGESEFPLWRVISRKMDSHKQMKSGMRNARFISASHSGARKTYNPKHKGSLPLWIKSK